MTCPSVKLSNGFSIPAVGLGTWQSKPNEVRDAVVAAIEHGYRHIDCAMVYSNEQVCGSGMSPYDSHSQQEVGEALKTTVGAIVKREDLFICSKLWNTKVDSPSLLTGSLTVF